MIGRRLSARQGLRPRKLSGITTSIVRCDRCGLIAANPQPQPARIEDHYELEPEQFWDASYFQPNDATQQILGAFSRLARTPNTYTYQPSALDIGAGVGNCLRELEAAGFHATGVEASAKFRDRAIELGTPPTSIVHGTVEEAMFAPGSFDLIVFGAVLEHLANPAMALARAASWLRPGGFMYVEVPSSNWLMSRLMRRWYRFTGTDFVINTSPMHPPYHLFEFTHRCFEIHGQSAGYELTEYEYHPCTTYLPGFASKLATRYMKMTDSGMQLAVWLVAGRTTS